MSLKKLRPPTSTEPKVVNKDPNTLLCGSALSFLSSRLPCTFATGLEIAPRCIQYTKHLPCLLGCRRERLTRGLDACEQDSLVCFAFVSLFVVVREEICILIQRAAYVLMQAWLPLYRRCNRYAATICASCNAYMSKHHAAVIPNIHIQAHTETPSPNTSCSNSNATRSIFHCKAIFRLCSLQSFPSRSCIYRHALRMQ